jgi:hypothetical protein
MSRGAKLSGAFLLMFNTHVSTGSSIFRGAGPNFTMTTKSITSYESTFSIGLRLLDGLERCRKGFMLSPL